MLTRRARENIKMLIDAEVRKQTGLNERSLKSLESKHVRIQQALDGVLAKSLGYRP